MSCRTTRTARVLPRRPVRAKSGRAGARRLGRYRTGVGYNPFRKRVQHTGDFWFVAAAIVVAVALVVWAVRPF